jgi:hypothetical protein
VRVYSHDSDWPRRSAILASDLLDVAAEELGNLGDRPLLPEQLPGTQTQHARNIGRPGQESESRGRASRSKISPVRQDLELFLLCLVGTVATVVAIALDDVLFMILFSAASILSFMLALRPAGDE